MFYQNKTLGNIMTNCENMGRVVSRGFRVLISRPHNDLLSLRILKVGILLGKHDKKGEISITKQQLIEVQTVKNTKEQLFMSFTMTLVDKNRKRAKIINQRRNFTMICLMSLKRSTDMKILICLINGTLIS